MPRKNVKEERRQQILDALSLCLKDKSFEKTSIKDIAKVAGVNHGVLHYYFESKESILLHYIDYVMEYYGSQFNDWIGAKDTSNYTRQDFIREIFEFVNHKITLNKDLSRLFVEIWEIALYNPAVKKKLQQTYEQWTRTISSMIQKTSADDISIEILSIAMVAFWEGMALFSTIIDSRKLNIKRVLTGFQQQILKLL
jgi:AcrR family transcriptional regulator